jgi:hypothetical protein
MTLLCNSGETPGLWTIHFVVLKGAIPIFFVKIKTFVALELGSACDAADNQMCTIFLDFLSNHLPQPKLIGLSAMGTHFAIYEYTPHDHHIDPPHIAAKRVVKGE